MPIAPLPAGKQKAVAFSLTSWSTVTARFISAAPFNRICFHAGRSGLAICQDPRTGKTYDGANSVSIGIEVANTGMNAALHKKLNTGKPYPNGSTVAASHRNGSKDSSQARDGSEWEVYPKAQLQSVFGLVALLMKRYDLHDITGQDCISS